MRSEIIGLISSLQAQLCHTHSLAHPFPYLFIEISTQNGHIALAFAHFEAIFS